MPKIILTRDTPFVIVLNAASGSADAGQEQARITDTLAAAQQKFEVLAVTDPQDLPKVAKAAARKAQRTAGAIIAAGGDGTINAVAQAALPTGRPFGIVPQGTFNYSSRAHGIPLDTVKATQALLNARLKPIQVGMVNERVFLVNASIGLYPQLLQDREAFKKQFGRYRLVAMWSGLVTLAHGHRQLVLEIEHDERREIIVTPTLFVGNNPLQLEQVGLPEVRAVEQQRLAAVIIKPVGTAALLWLAVRGALGQLGDAGNVRDFAFTRMTVRPVKGRLGGSGGRSWLRSRTETIKVATDGEIWRASLPIEFSVAAQPLLLMTPDTPVANGSRVTESP
jgi:diacylglycerol kinase family enzyme